MKYRQIPEMTFASEELPTSFPIPNITLPKEKLISFNQTLKELGNWAADICGTDFKKLCSLDLMRFSFELRQLREQVADYEKVLEAYSKRPKRYWSTGSPGQYDPSSGFTGVVDGYADDYPEARAVIKKWSK